MLRRRASAKINLYLRVLGKRPDGFHEIETLFQRISLADELALSVHPTDLRLTCSDPSLSCGEDNLILKAARLLQKTTGERRGAEVHLTKRIPIAAGLGGGSSDCAAALTGLNELWECGLKREQLVHLASQLGSDVPFFLCGSAFAIGQGRGEQCRSVPVKVSLAQVLVVPDEALSTRDIYQQAEFNLTAEKPSVTLIEHALSNGSLGELAKGLWNDLEPEAIRRCPSILNIQKQLRESGCLGVRLSGSGPSVFGLCRDFHHAAGVAQALRHSAKPSWRIEAVTTDNDHAGYE